MESKMIQDPNRALTLLLAGNARFTLVSPKTGTRFTYRVKASDDGRVWFVSLMQGSSNEDSFRYMGIIDGQKRFRQTGKSRIGPDAPSVKAFTFTFQWLLAGQLSVEFWHEGKCCRCGRTLTVPASIELGIGPDCAAQMGLHMPSTSDLFTKSDHLVPYDVKPLDETVRS